MLIAFVTVRLSIAPPYYLRLSHAVYFRFRGNPFNSVQQPWFACCL